MLRSQAINTAKTVARCQPAVLPAAAKSVRNYAVNSPPGAPAGPAPNPMKDNQPKKADNTLLYTSLAIGGGAAAYFYFRGGEEDLKAKKRRDEERVRINTRQAADAAKDRAHDTILEGRAKVERAEDKTRQTFDATRSLAEDTRLAAEENARGLINRAGETIESAKHTTKNSLSRARDSTEDLYKDARDSTDRKAAELRAGAGRAGGEVKEGWFEWLGFGRAKVEEGEDALRQNREKLESEADRLKREAATKVAGAAGDVKVRAEKHA